MSDSEDEDYESADEGGKSIIEDHCASCSWTGNADPKLIGKLEAATSVHCNTVSGTIEHDAHNRKMDSLDPICPSQGATSNYHATDPSTRDSCLLSDQTIGARRMIAAVDNNPTASALDISAHPPVYYLPEDKYESTTTEKLERTKFPGTELYSTQNLCSAVTAHYEESVRTFKPSSCDTSNTLPDAGDVSLRPATTLDRVSSLPLKDGNYRPKICEIDRKERDVEERDKPNVQSDALGPVCASDEGWEIESVPDIPAEDMAASETELDFENHVCKVVDSSDERHRSTAGFPSFEPSTGDCRIEEEPVSGWTWSAVSSFAQHLTSFQTKGLNLVYEGVNVLEKIGKKTMSVLEETDPGFKYTKQFLRPPGLHDRPNLSKVVREAYERQIACDQSKESFMKSAPGRNSFATQLESNHGLVHLEALEMISDRAESQLYILLSKAADKLSLHNDLLESIWTALQLDYEGESEETCKFPNVTELNSLAEQDVPHGGGSCLRPSNLPEQYMLLWNTFQITLEKLKPVHPTEHLMGIVVNIWNGIERDRTEPESQSVFQSAIAALAKATSADLEYLHKMSECVLVQIQGQQTDPISLASVTASLIHTSILLNSAMCDVYIKIIKSLHSTTGDDPDRQPVSPDMRPSQLVASLMLECNNAEDYMKNAARLLIPVLQLAYVKCHLAD
ncbi:unnamed protein product [Dicrocoelium dendriticum]|nr:unnamed protein product [Dicrocoelium dendriticum]